MNSNDLNRQIVGISNKIYERQITNEIYDLLFNPIKEREQHQQILNKKVEIQKKLAGKLLYHQWMILWDLLNNAKYQINADLKKGKISKSDITHVMSKANTIHDIFTFEGIEM